MLLKISQNSQEAPVSDSFFNKNEGLTNDQTHFKNFAANAANGARFLTCVGPFCRPATLLKRGSGTGVFLGILRNFQDYLFYRTPPDNCFQRERERHTERAHWSDMG